MSMFERFLRDRAGAAAIEYGLIVAGIAVARIAVINSIGGGLQCTYSGVSNGLANAGQSRRLGVDARVET
jgi:pilus assembly protein Flp/PilA